MAGDWIKVEKATARKPEIFGIATALNISLDHAFGACVRFWFWCDDQMKDGHATSVTGALLDDAMGLPGFSDALVSVGWLQVRSGSLVIPHFDRHLGRAAKSRADAANRQRASRSKQPAVTHARDSGHSETKQMSQKAVTNPSPEKRREEYLKPPPSKSNVDQEPKASTDPVSVTWGLVAERLRKAGMARVSSATEEAKKRQFTPEQIIQWLDFLADKPQIGPGAILDRIRTEDARLWSADFGWPPPPEVSAPTIEARTPTRKLEGRDVKDFEKLNAEFGAELDALTGEQIEQIRGPSRDKLNLDFERSDPIRRLMLLQKFKAFKAKAAASGKEPK